MSLFERIQNRINEVKVTGDTEPPKSGADEVLRQKYKDDLAKKKGYVLNPTEKKKGMRLGDKLEKDIDLGARLQDKTGKRTPKQAYAQGMPFQPDDNPATKFQRSNKGRYPTSGKSILNKRFQYQSDIKSSEREAVKSRLKTRLGYVSDPKLKDTGDINKLVDKVAKRQKLNTATGKDSSLFKTLKKYTAATEPTVKGKYGKPARMVRGKDGVLRQYGGGQVPMPSGKKRDALIKKNLAKFDDDLVKGANIPKGTYIPKGGVPARSDIKTGKVTYTRPFEPKELNLQYKADKLKLDYGGRIAERDPKISGMTAAQKKANYEKIKARIDKKNPTFKSPLTGGKLPLTPENMKKYKVNKAGLTKGQSFRKFAKKAAKSALKFGMNNKRLALAGLGLAATGAYFAPKIFGGDKDKLTFKKSSVIKNKSGDDVTFKYPTYSDRKVKDNLLKKDPNLKLDPYKNYSDGSYKPNIRNASTGFLGRNKNKQKPFTDKFKSGEFKVDNVPKAAIRGGDKFDLNKNLATSAFEKQLQKAEKGSGFGKIPFRKNFLKTYQTKKDKKFLKKYSNATRPT